MLNSLLQSGPSLGDGISSPLGQDLRLTGSWVW
ncbi:hypothetical protein F0726_02515 [Acidithiobacillus caldus]|nr:hypothetical protein F0726_02515 [Acidithiobacillus caldus]